MNNTSELDDDEMLPEYDLKNMPGGVRGKYYERYMANANLAKLDPEVRAAFPTDESVNAALRSLIGKPQTATPTA